MSGDALVLQHGDLGPPAVLGQWALARGVALDVHRGYQGEPFPEPDRRPFVASLGSPHSAADEHVPEVAAELHFIERAVAAGTPVLGLCYGGQVLAKVLGAQVGPAMKPELGWYKVESNAPDLVQQGPWLEWHFDSFTLPPDATELATSGAGLQAFAHGPHLGVQFHPESTIEIVSAWAREDTPRLRALGIEDGEAIVRRGSRHAENAVKAAFALFDAFWHRTRSCERSNTCRRPTP